jgi:hypothetical protein
MNTELRVEVRHNDDGFTRAALQLPDTTWMVLCSVPTPAYEASEAVRDAVVVLAKAVVHQAVLEAVSHPDDQPRTH